MARNQLKIFRGRTYPFTYNHTDSTGAAVDLTGATVYFTVKEDISDDSADDSTALIKKTVTSHSDPTNGTTTWTLDDSDTYIEPGNYSYDVVVEYAGLAEPPSLYGDFVVQGSPTNRNVGNE